MPGIRVHQNVRSKLGVEFKECEKCRKTLDIVRFTVYWYQPKANKIAVGTPVRRRLNSCKECTKKRDVITSKVTLP
jgi:hypothetical protein